AVCENSDRMLVIPIDENILEQVGVTAIRDGRKEIACDECTTLRHTLGLEQAPRAFETGGEVEEDAAHLRIGLQEPCNEGSLATAHVDKGGDPGKVIGRSHSPGCLRRSYGHIRIERFSRVSMVRKVVVEGHIKDM